MNTRSPERLSLFASTAPGLEALAAGELRALGIPAVPEQGGASWEGTLEDVHRANLHLRTASRVLVRVATFRARTFAELERRAGRVAWDRWVGAGRAVRLRVTSRKSRLYHTGAIAERIIGQIERVAGPLAHVSTGSASDDEADGAEGRDEQLFIVRFLRDECTISVDSSGDLLHRRGYRQALAKAPLRETIAAAMLLASGWDTRAPLVDPFCGSGTIPIEAALLACRIPPGLANPSHSPRPYAFESWPDHDVVGWDDVVARAREAILPSTGVAIEGADRDRGAIAAAQANAARAGVEGDVAFEARALSALMPPPGTGWLVTNPPYGVRVGEKRPLRDLYAALGNVARDRLAGWTITLLSPDPALEAQTRISFTEALRTRNGGIPVRVVVGRV